MNAKSHVESTARHSSFPRIPVASREAAVYLFPPKLQMPMSATPVVTTLSLRRLTRGAVSLALALLSGTAAAQTMNTYLPPALLDRNTQPRQSFYQLGEFDLNPHASLSTIYDDNIGQRSTNRENDLITVFSPGFDILKASAEQESMSSLRLTYNPAFIFFAKHDTNNSIDHFARVNAGLRTAKLTLGLSQDFETSSGGIVDVGGRVSQDSYNTVANASYQVSEKTSVAISGSYRITDYEQLIDSTQWSEDNAAHYQITPKVSLGLGVTVGQLIVGEVPRRLPGINTSGIGTSTNLSSSREGNTQTFVSPSLRASYRTTEKTDVSLSFGLEYRTFENSAASLSPVFSLSGRYTPWETTSFSIEGHQRQQNSAVLGGQNYISTGFGVSAHQKLRDRVNAHLSFSFENADYESVHRGVASSRRDDYFLLRYGLDAILASSWSVGVFHQYRENTSTSGFAFDNNQVGLQTVWSY